MDEDEIEYTESMTVIDCIDCDGSGEVGDLACGNPDAIFDDFGRHVVPVETLDDLDGETGPDAMGLQVVETAPVAREDAEELDWPADPIGVVVVGQDDGLAHRVSRALGGTDGPFTREMADQIDEYREALGLTDYPEGTVVGKVWACVLPPMTVGYRGVEVMWLCRALGLEPSKVITTQLMAAAVDVSNPDAITNCEGDVAKCLAKYEFDMFDWLEVL